MMRGNMLPRKVDELPCVWQQWKLLTTLQVRRAYTLYTHIAHTHTCTHCALLGSTYWIRLGCWLMAHWQQADVRRQLLCQLKAKCCILNADMTQQVATPQDTPTQSKFVAHACGCCCCSCCCNCCCCWCCLQCLHAATAYDYLRILRKNF